MTISGVSTSSLLQSLLNPQSGTSSSSSSSSSLASALAALESASGGSTSSSSAYSLSLGQQKDSSSLLGYGQLGKLVTQAESALASMQRNDPVASVTTGNGAALTQSYSVDVQQLAQGEVLTSAGYSDPSQVIGTGTLGFQAGTYDAATDTFSATGNSTTISVTDGSLTGIAAAINGAKDGLSAQVTTGSDGQSHLQVSGPTGAGCAFTISGIPGLTYDPANPSFTDMTATQTAQDAVYSVNGAAAQTSSTNAGVTIADGLTTTLTATGTTTVTAPFGQGAAVKAANALVSAVNALVGGLGTLTASGGELAGDTGIASKLSSALGQVAGQSFSGLGQYSSLSAIGITVQSDGTLAVDQSSLQSAYAADPSGTNALLNRAAKAIGQALGGTQGAGDQIKAQMQTFAAQLAAVPSLAELLGQAQSSSTAAQGFGTTGSSGATGSSGSSASSLAQMLANAGGSSSSGSSATSAGEATLAKLLASLGTSA